jgi:hypothetical protein
MTTSTRQITPPLHDVRPIDLIPTLNSVLANDLWHPLGTRQTYGVKTVYGLILMMARALFHTIFSPNTNNY